MEAKLLVGGAAVLKWWGRETDADLRPFESAVLHCSML
jgi:hypothetical protein